MKVSIFEEKHFQKSVWSGGSTTQLYIFPAEASYAERNFDVRISMAKVEVDHSTFTPLPGVNRKLIILDGEITINHQNHYTKQLKQFEVDSFKGDWNTTAIGKCTDFNVMTTGDIQSEIFSLDIAPNNNIQIKLEEHWRTLCLFVIKGNLYIEANQETHHIIKDNLLVMNNINEFVFPIRTIDHSQIVVVKIN